MSERIDKLRDAVQVMHRVRATHLESVVVQEMFGKQVAWEGVVEAFTISGHPTASICYAWSYELGAERQFVTVLAIPPITSAQNAVRAAIAAQVRSERDVVSARDNAPRS